MTHVKLAAVLTVALLALTGCGSGGGDASPATITDTDPTATEAETQETAAETESAPAPPAPVTIAITVRDGRPVGGIARPTVRRGDRVVLVVRSDISGEVHLHGYDLEQAVAPGSPARIRFRATVPGRFEIELHAHPELHIGELTVRP